MNKLKKELWFVILAVLLAGILRLVRLDFDLLFHRDQGMHALSVWQVWHEHEFKLLGHSTDVDGIYHGPIFHWLMALPYGLSGGSPVVASAFQIFLELTTLPLLYLAIKKLFNQTTASLAILLYAISFGLIGYSRWLSNVTPILPLANTLLWLLVWPSQENKWWYWGSIGLVLGLIVQMNGAVGFAITPGVLWALKPKITMQRLALILGGVVLPAVPQITFELRHDFVMTRAFLTFVSSGDGGGLSPFTFWRNLLIWIRELGHLLSWQVPVIAAILWTVGLLATWKHDQRRLIWSLSLGPILTLALFQRGALGFFYVSGFGLALALVTYAVTRRWHWLLVGLLFLTIGLNLYHDRRLLAADNGLIPIGSANLITIADRQNILDWVYQMADGEPFAIWIYTIPYYQDDAYAYMFIWYAQDRFGYQPVSLGGFSPGEVKIKHFFAVYEPDWNKPERLNQWQVEVTKNWGEPTSIYNSHDAAVSWHKLE